jgi:hypothetical protein
MSGRAFAGRTCYIFVSHEQTNDIAVIDPQQDYQDDVIDVLDVARSISRITFQPGRIPPRLNSARTRISSLLLTGQRRRSTRSASRTS